MRSMPYCWVSTVNLAVIVCARNVEAVGCSWFYWLWLSLVRVVGQAQVAIVNSRHMRKGYDSHSVCVCVCVC